MNKKTANFNNRYFLITLQYNDIYLLVVDVVGVSFLINVKNLTV